ncbi:glycosyltransferase family 4 protein [Falsiroseomonas selenitidurans]|uniref:Glycosyltransferase family 4 protein n=1 Tax=Falsiroseomonas selenitidurans TaxID=2716335 RepID=A0ABX1DWQ6_9PROT|nr:glycosyltransferase family 4 protein [Falsiroseomonas selenitidurans]NKC29342.1 glycosyltransferase family 4 protein [Falsiroseomonas selenitidurans]
MRLLVFCHNHPDLQPGGTEVVARGLFRALRDTHGVEGLFLGAVTAHHRERRPGTLFQSIGAQPDEMLVWLSHFDRFHLSQVDSWGLQELVAFVTDYQPDVIHFHHLLYFGIETLDMVRRVVPKAKIVVTLHDFFAICPQEGQLLTTDGRLCNGPSADGCKRCFPGRGSTDLVLREIAVRGAMAGVDLILSPSDFLRDRFIAAGWDAGRIEVLRNGIAGGLAAPPRVTPDGRRDRFGFFGHINRFKGALIALGASARLSRQGVAHDLALHGGTAWQADEFLAEFKAALEAAPDARHHGLYGAAELPARIAAVDWVVMPSIWWENAPLVVQEAFRHGRPVICGHVGGMAESVRDGVDGLHFPVGDAVGLAAAMRRAAEDPGLWGQLSAGIAPPRLMETAAAEHMALYQRLLGEVPALPRGRRAEGRARVGLG